jgi:hypothetical protein
MKTLFILSLFSILSFSAAHASFHKIIECNNGDLIVDQGSNDESGRPTYQMVLKGAPLDHFLKEGAVDSYSVNTKGEFILSVNSYNSLLLGTIGISAGIQRTFYLVQYENKEVDLHSNIGGRVENSTSVAEYKFYNCKI